MTFAASSYVTINSGRRALNAFKMRKDLNNRGDPGPSTGQQSALTRKALCGKPSAADTIGPGHSIDQSRLVIATRA